MFELIKEDIAIIKKHDPAAGSTLQVVLTCPGWKANRNHRLAHRLWRRKYYLLAKMVAAITRFTMGIDIHPAAVIGRRFFIDHGRGVVIGETAVIGNDVLIYQGVTLGGTGKEKGKRHPTVKDNVMISAGAVVLGSITIGENVKIGASSVVLNDVPANATVVGVPGEIVMLDGVKVIRNEERMELRLNEIEEELVRLKDEMNKITKG